MASELKNEMSSLSGWNIRRSVSANALVQRRGRVDRKNGPADSRETSDNVERVGREEIEIRRRVRLLDPTLHEGKIGDRMLQTCPVVLSTANASIRVATAGGLRIDVMQDTNITSGVAFPYSSNTVGLSRGALRLLLPVVPALPGDPREQQSPSSLECV